MLSYSVLFIKKVNLLCFHHWCLSRKFKNVLQEQKQPPEVFCKSDILKSFTIFTEKRLCWSHFFNKVPESCLQHSRFIKKRLQHRCFSMNIVNILRTRTMKNICEELFLEKLAASVLALLLNAGYLLTGWPKLPISKSLPLQRRRGSNFMIVINQRLVPLSKVW